MPLEGDTAMVVAIPTMPRPSPRPWVWPISGNHSFHGNLLRGTVRSVVNGALPEKRRSWHGGLQLRWISSARPRRRGAVSAMGRGWMGLKSRYGMVGAASATRPPFVAWAFGIPASSALVAIPIVNEACGLAIDCAVSGVG